MAENTYTEQIVREAPKIEAYKAGIYQDALDYVKRLQGIDPASGEEIFDPVTGLPRGRSKLHGPWRYDADQIALVN